LVAYFEAPLDEFSTCSTSQVSPSAPNFVLDLIEERSVISFMIDRRRIHDDTNFIRRRINRLCRQTICFSQSIKIREIIIGLFIQNAMLERNI
jgi:hypothetical protein